MWQINNIKHVKINRKGRIAFQYDTGLSTRPLQRGLSISKEAFYKMEDVTITPDMKTELEANVFLKNYGRSILLIKYCTSRDGVQCQGGIFTFTPSEWLFFWNNIRNKVLNAISKSHYLKQK